jgi:hypothetical protein
MPILKKQEGFADETVLVSDAVDHAAKAALRRDTGGTLTVGATDARSPMPILP